MKVVHNPKTVRAGDVRDGRTFKFIGEGSLTPCDYIVMKRNSNFRILNSCGLERVDDRVLVYNISCMCFGIVNPNQQVVETDAELTING